ncbi:MAG: B12-binding domain-containing radical SAM protein [Polyangiaceae bacterium]|jgi:radical SAM superfamily enzyme YgiQ (UPF0313 family)
MNSLLVYPEFPDTFWSFKYALRFVGKRAAHPPLGLLTVAAMLPPAWPKRLVDLNAAALTDEDLAWADCVFLSAMTVQRPSAKRIIARCKAHGVRIVAGGPLFTSEPEQFPDVDHLVLNEGEVTLPLFLRDLERGEPMHVYRTSEFADMRSSPTPLWELLNRDAYATMAVQYSRGCPYDCEFCNVTALLGHRPRTKSADQVIRELQGLYELGWHRGVFFVDDNLIGNKRTLMRELLPALIDWRKTHPGMDFNTEASINLADDATLMSQMVTAGFNMVFVGIETPDPASLAECNKKHNLNRDMVADVKRMHRAGLQVQGGFIVGFDSDTPSSVSRIIEFIQCAGIVSAMVGLLQAMPGTRLHARMKEAGRLLEDSTSGDNVNGKTNIVSTHDALGLREQYREGLRRLYSPKPYYERVRTFLREYRLSRSDAPYNIRYEMQQLLAFARSVGRLGIAGAERTEYWKLLIWTIFHRPKAFPLAVTLAICGYHFRRTCEVHLA